MYHNSFKREKKIVTEAHKFSSSARQKKLAEVNQSHPTGVTELRKQYKQLKQDKQEISQDGTTEKSEIQARVATEKATIHEYFCSFYEKKLTEPARI